MPGDPAAAHGPAAAQAGPGQVLLTPDPRLVAEDGGPLADALHIGDPALAELRLDDLLDELLTRVRAALHVDTVAVLLRDETGNELVARAAKGLEAEVEAGVRIPVGHGFAGRIAHGRQPIFIPELDTADVVNPILRDIGIHSMLGVPLIVQGDLIGVLHVGSLTPREFTPGDAALLELAAGRVAPAIERARLLDALNQQRRAAEALQRGLLPASLPQLPDVDVAVRYVPARDEIGGDWYDVVALRGGKVAITIGDVAGHGIRAAALMAQVRAALRAYALDDPQPSSVLARLDRYLQHTHGLAMATVVHAVVDPLAGAVTFSSAGHPPPVIVGPDGARALDLPVAPPLGVRPFPVFADTEVAFGDDETVLLYTDGLVERRGESLGDGIDRLLAVAGTGDRRPDALCTRALTDVLAARASEDDVALVALARVPSAGVLRLRLPASRDALAPLRRRLRAWLRVNGADASEADAIVLAVGEAAANAVEHAYPPAPAGFEVRASIEDGVAVVRVTDDGRWREHRGSAHRGRGLKIMRASMDEVDLLRTDDGTQVVLRRRLGKSSG